MVAVTIPILLVSPQQTIYGIQTFLPDLDPKGIWEKIKLTFCLIAYAVLGEKLRMDRNSI